MQEIPRWEERFDAWFSEHWQHHDSAHDLGHLRRVWATAQQILKQEIAEPLVVLTACYFHDIVNLPKNDPCRAQASSLAAKETLRILNREFPDFPDQYLHGVSHAVMAHSYSAGIPATTPEAKIVQDADRIESLGAIGIARVFYTSGALNRPLFDPDDPFAGQRQLDDTRWTLDHFQIKLLKLPALMHTQAGKQLATVGARWMAQFLAKFAAELDGQFTQIDNQRLRQFMQQIS